MSGKGRVGKEVVLPDRSGKDVHGEPMDLSSLQSCGLSHDESRKQPETLDWEGGTYPRSAYLSNLLSTLCLKTDKGRTEGLHTSHLALAKNVGSPKQEYSRHWRRKPNSTQRTAVMVRADLL